MSTATQLIDMEIVRSIQNLEKKGATNFLKKQVSAFEERLPEQLEIINDSLKTGNCDELVAHVHKLNGFASSLGAKEVRKICIELEKRGHLGSLDGTESLLTDLETALGLTISLLKDLTA